MTNTWQFPSRGYRDSGVRSPPRQTPASNRRRCHRCRRSPPPRPLLLLLDAPMGFRFGHARNTGKIASCVAPPPSTSLPSLQNKRAWLSTNSLILSKDAHRVDHGGLPFPSSGSTSLPSASSQSASIQSLSSRSPPPPPPRDNLVARHPQLAVQHQERARSSPTLQ